MLKFRRCVRTHGQPFAPSDIFYVFLTYEVDSSQVLTYVTVVGGVSLSSKRNGMQTANARVHTDVKRNIRPNGMEDLKEYKGPKLIYNCLIRHS